MVMSIFKSFKSLFMSQENIPNPTADAAQVPTVVSLDLQPNMVNEPLEVLVNGIKIGEGEAVIVEGKFGLKIKKIGNEDLKLSHIGL